MPNKLVPAFDFKKKNPAEKSARVLFSPNVTIFIKKISQRMQK
jgi:hypothetical protein